MSPNGSDPAPWTVIARNLPEHAGNAIHTDEGARAAGFPSALVAGVTTYAYLSHPIVAAWGLDWLRRGGGEVRFRSPVPAGHEVRCVPEAPGPDGEVVVAAECPGLEPNPRAVLRAVRDGGEPPPFRPGDPLPSYRVELSDRYGIDYGSRIGDDLGLYARRGIVHPAVWPALANLVTAAELVRGPWIHTRSAIRHHAVCPSGVSVEIHSTVVRRFERRGERVVLDVVIEHEGRPLATLEHEAIVALPGR